MILICAHCGSAFERHYRMNATRAANPQYCSRSCVAAASSAKGAERWRGTFVSRIDAGASNACWPWKGRRDPKGYGRFDLNGKPQLAHRLAYYLKNPEADQSLTVCHSCDNPPCCNPTHLWLGTQADNTADRHRKGRTKTGVIRGEANNNAKLTAEQALEIFTSAEAGPALAAKFGISKEAVNHIKRGKNWAHVTGGRNAQ